MCGPQIKKYVDIGSTSSLNIKEVETSSKEKDAKKYNDSFLVSSSFSNYLSDGLSMNSFASLRRTELEDETMLESNTNTVNKDNYSNQQYYHATNDLQEQETLSPRSSLCALEYRSEQLSDSLLYTFNVAAETRDSKEVTNSHKRTLEDDSSLPSLDLQSSSRPKRVKRSKRNVYSPSSSDQNETVENPSTKKRAGRKKKRKGAPSRPLCAYNFFFKQERMRLINLSSDHPKIGFSSMGKIIGTKWKSLSEKDKAPYKALADKDHERYARELEIFEEKERMAAGNFPLASTTSADDTFKTQEDLLEEELHSSTTLSTNSSFLTHQDQEELQDQEESTSSYKNAYEDAFQDIEPIPLNEVWKPNNHSYKSSLFQNEALYGFFNFGDFLNDN